LAGDAYECAGNDSEAIAHWLAALRMASTHTDWDSTFDRIEETFRLAGREAELPGIRAAHPRPASPPEKVAPPADALDAMMNHSLDADLLPDGMYEPPQQLHRAKTVGRNDPCPCGSGKKYKKCCMK